MHEDLDAFDDPVCLGAHEYVITGDVGFAFGTIDHQGVDGIVRTMIDFYAGGESCAAESHDAGPANTFPQQGRIKLFIMRQWFRQFRPLLLIICLKDDAGSRQSRWMGHGLIADLHHSARRRSMYGRAYILAGTGDGLSLEYLVSG